MAEKKSEEPTERPLKFDESRPDGNGCGKYKLVVFNGFDESTFSQTFNENGLEITCQGGKMNKWYLFKDDGIKSITHEITDLKKTAKDKDGDGVIAFTVKEKTTSAQTANKPSTEDKRPCTAS